MSQNETTLLIVAVIIVAIGLRIWRATREQRFKIGSMWVAPAIFTLLTVWVLAVDRLTTLPDILLAVVALIAGGALGWYQGTHTTLRIDRTARVVFVKAKPIGALIFIAIIAPRLLIRTSSVLPAIQNGSLAAGSPPMPLAGSLAGTISSLLLVLALGVILGLRAYILRKYQEPEGPANG